VIDLGKSNVMTDHKPTISLHIDSVITYNGTQSQDIAGFLICQCQFDRGIFKNADRPEVTHRSDLCINGNQFRF